MTKRIFLNLLLTFFSFTYCLAQQPPATWINEHALPIDGSEATQTKYFAYLADQLKGNTICGLAEASHGTHEFSVEKTHIINYLIRHENYKSIGFEFGHSPMAAINNYLHTGKGDLKQLMKTLRLFNNQEIFELFQSIKVYNDAQAPAGKVTLFGFDTDYFTSDIAASALYCSKYLTANPQLYTNTKAALPVLEKIAAPGDNNLYDLSDSETGTIASLNNEVKVKSNSAEFKKRLSLLYQGTLGSNPLARDEFMAENIADFQQADKAKTIIWGHNLHLAKDTTMAQCKAMGYYVRKTYGEQYYAIGFDTFKGSVTVMDGDDFVKHNFETKPASFSAVFANAKFPAFFIAFSNINGNPFYNVTNNITNIYANWGNSGTLPMRPGIDFDGLIFIKETTASVPLN